MSKKERGSIYFSCVSTLVFNNEGKSYKEPDRDVCINVFQCNAVHLCLCILLKYIDEYI